tara:strand:- start:884 stop:3793 length:2910 start_codon:yes stop_codon:yes gene_type:complete
MLKNYFQLVNTYREKYGKNTILLFQVGAFYEVYTKVDEKTKTINEEQIIQYKKATDLASAKKTETVLMMGFRDYVLEKYIEKIINYGFTTVVYNQDSQSANTTRSLFGVYSPGTYFSLTDDKLSNNLSCIWIQLNKRTTVQKGNLIIGMANIDNYTGKSCFYENISENIHNPTSYDDLERFISTYNPNEIIIISNLEEKQIQDIIRFSKIESKKIHCYSSNDEKIKKIEKQTYQREILNKYFSYDLCESLYKNSIEFVFGIQSYLYLLDFVYEHNPNLVYKIQEPIIENKSDKLLLANHSLQQLNMLSNNQYKGKLACVSSFLNNCVTPMGYRHFHYMILHPTFNVEILNEKYNITDHLLNTSSWQQYRTTLKTIRDIEKQNRQLYIKKILPQQLFYFFENLSTIENLFSVIKNDKIILQYLQNKINTNISNDCKLLQQLFEKTFIKEICQRQTNFDFDENFIQKNINQELDKQIYNYFCNEKKLQCVQKYYNQFIQKGEKKKQETEFIKTHQTEKTGLFIQCTNRRSKLLKSELEKIKEDAIILKYTDFENKEKTFSLKKEVHFITAQSSNVNIVNETISEITKELFSIKIKVKDLITLVYNDFLKKLQTYEEKFQNIILFCSLIDNLQNMCYLAEKNNYCKPVIKKGNQSSISAKKIRHPLIEKLNEEEIYVPNDISLGKENKNLHLLYGTNAVGKTSLIKSIGICIIMAQAGLYVPCSEFEYVPYKSLFTRILGNDNLFKGLSTFAVEMSELRIILKMADENSLILGDELCSGTEHESAVSIFVSGLQSLFKKNCSCIFATHLHEILDFEEVQSMDLCIQHMEVIFDKENDILVYDRKLKPGSGKSLYGLEVCKSLHLPEEFIENAYSLRKKYNKINEGILDKKHSHFSSKKIMNLCEICKKNLCEEIHHLQHQQYANKQNKIDHFHKNHPANLLGICESCHDKIHKSDKQHKKTKTSKGIEIREI